MRSSRAPSFVLAALASLPLALGGCSFASLDEFSIDNVDAADAELDTDSHWLWSRYDSTDQEAITEVIARTHAVVEHARSTGDFPLQRRLGRLGADDVSTVGLSGKVDPGRAVGMMIATDIGCTLAQVERVTVARNQPELYPNVYVTYDRAYAASDGDFLAGKSQRLEWTTTLTADLKGEYTSTLHGAIRFVDGVGPAAQPVLWVRSFFPEPAKYTSSPDNHWNQDYQVELYYERAPGTVTHVYALWRDLALGSLTLETEFATSVQLAGLVDWDVRTGKLCHDGQAGPP
jgi:hypothetical protein